MLAPSSWGLPGRRMIDEMKRERGVKGRSESPVQQELKEALGAMTAEELREFLLGALERRDTEWKRTLADAVLECAARGRSRWIPRKPAGRVVEKAKEFAEAARRIGYADPVEVDEFLRQGSRAFLAGEFATAREVFETLLPPVADADINLDQYELVDEVLTVDIYNCAAQYLASVYLTTPLADRAQAVHMAMQNVEAIAAFSQPLQAMERTATSTLPELSAFIPRWLQYLEGQPSSRNECDGNRDRWLREAVLRGEGVAGLERIARKTKKPAALQAWCNALAQAGDWSGALSAYDAAVKMSRASHWRGMFLDGAALAAQQLGRPDADNRLKAAWLGAPSLVRLLRWLGAGNPTTGAVVGRAKRAVGKCPAKEGRQLGLLYVLTGDLEKAAALLTRAPGLGWSEANHPAHLLFPAFATFLTEGTEAELPPALLDGLRQKPREFPYAGWVDDESDEDADWDEDWNEDWDEAESRSQDGALPELACPSIMDLLEVAQPDKNIESASRRAMRKAMQTAVAKRADGILANKRRSYYAQVAALAACCLEISAAVGERDSAQAWLEALRKKYSRFYAFQGELKNALASVGRG